MNTKSIILLLIIFLSLVSYSYAENRTIFMGNQQLTDAYVLFSNGVNVSVPAGMAMNVIVDLSPNDTYTICDEKHIYPSRPVVLPRYGWVIAITSLDDIWGSIYEGF